MTVLAKLCEFRLRQIPSYSSRSDNCFPDSVSGSSWPGAVRLMGQILSGGTAG